MSFKYHLKNYYNKRIEAKPKKERNPKTSVIVVKMTPEARAGSTLNLFNVISNDKLVMSKITSNKLKAIFNYSSHFKSINLIFKRVFK